MIKIKIKYLINLICFFLVISCINKEKESIKAEGEIISLFIDKLSKPFPPPPPPPIDGSEPKEINWDSINTVQTDIIVDTIKMNIDKNLKLPLEFKNYQILTNSLSDYKKESIAPEIIRSKERHRIIHGNSLDDFKGKYPQMISFSNIEFNKSHTSAALYVGYKTHELSSYVNFYLLNKNDGNWKIVYKKNIEKS